jgi:hypothetical protein
MNYIKLSDKPKVKIVPGRSYRATDYRGRPLPGLWIPLSRDAAGWWNTRTPQGGLCKMKPAEFSAQQ